MFQVFRKIRQKLLAEGKLRRYLAYAAGEIILVVIGILIALEINDWQKWKRDRQDEQSYLSRLSEDLKLDCEDIREANVFAFRRIAISTWALAQLGDSSKEFQPQFILRKAVETAPVPENWTKDSLGLAFSRLLGARIFDHADITFQEMVSTSKIQVIRDIELRTAINRHYAAAKKAKDVNLEIQKAQQSFLDALKSLGITPNTAVGSPDLQERLRGSEQVLVELKYLRDMALRHLQVFEQPENGLYDRSKTLIQDIEKQLEQN